jgi:dihydropteroate synthase
MTTCAVSDWADRFPRRAARWQLRTRTLELPRRPLLMGVLNVTPDSFSDGGLFYDLESALEQAVQLTEAGADILDIGGESTQPYSQPIDAAEELRRVLPVIDALGPKWPVPISIDTSKAEVAWACVQAGAEIINDVTALSGDPRMISVARETRAAVCAMHMQGNPQTMQDHPTYTDVVADILGLLAQRRDSLLAAGIAAERIALDPGIGFGKTHQHNLTLLANCHRFHELGCPLLVGHSRKGFIAKVLGDKLADRAAGSVGVSLALASQGVQILRVHDVAATRQALLLYGAAGGIDGSPLKLAP